MRAAAVILVWAIGGSVWAQAPVEERAVPQSPAAAAQMKAELARHEQADAERALRLAEQDLAEAKRKERAAAEQFNRLRQQREAAQQAADQALARKRRADDNLARAAAEVTRAWGKP